MFQKLYLCFAAGTIFSGFGGLAEAQQSEAAENEAANIEYHVKRFDGVELEPCHIAGVAGELLCGSIRVFENRSKKEGKTIDLKIVILPALETPIRPDPMFVLMGGPGQAATAKAQFFSQAFSEIRKHHDLVLVDQRGTGGSNPLKFQPAEEHLFDELSLMFPTGWVENALKLLSKENDLTQYTTSIAMDDLDDVRKALGYDKINMYGTSYGTRAALANLDRVRSIVMKAIVPPSMAIGVIYHTSIERALDMVFEEVEGDPALLAAFPNLESNLQKTMEQLERHPAKITVRNPHSGKPLEVLITRNGLATVLKYLLYSPGSRSQVPLVISQTTQSDFSAAAAMLVRIRRAYYSEFYFGMSLSVVAAEDAARCVASLEEASKSTTIFRDAWLREIVEASRHWPKGEDLKASLETIRPDVPVLLLSGDLDPVTPPEYAEELRQLLPNSKHLVIPNLGHSLGFTGGQLERVIAEFVDKGSMAGVETAGLNNVEGVRFVMPPNKTKR